VIRTSSTTSGKKKILPERQRPRRLSVKIVKTRAMAIKAAGKKFTREEAAGSGDRRVDRRGTAALVLRVMGRGKKSKKSKPLRAAPDGEREHEGGTVSRSWR